jgi:hypothetical protein
MNACLRIYPISRRTERAPPSEITIKIHMVVSKNIFYFGSFIHSTTEGIKEYGDPQTFKKHYKKLPLKKDLTVTIVKLSFKSIIKIV